jgi:hypothetical protein
VKVRRRPPADVLVRDGETAVLVDGTIVRLSELSSMLYAECSTEKTSTELSRSLEATFGAPPDGSALEATERAITEMLAHGVLELVSD